MAEVEVGQINHVVGVLFPQRPIEVVALFDVALNLWLQAALVLGSCAAPAEAVRAAIEELCVGSSSCVVPTTVPALAEGWGGCPGVTLHTAIEMTCEPFTALEIVAREWGVRIFVAFP